MQNDNVNGHRDHDLPHHPAYSQLAIFDDARFINTFAQLMQVSHAQAAVLLMQVSATSNTA
jgi:hypothetical protein